MIKNFKTQKELDNYQQKSQTQGSNSMGVFDSITNLVTGLTGTIVGGIQNKKAREQQNEQWKKDFNEAVRQYNQNYEQSEKWNTISQQNYENATQIRANDLAKAGMNPLMAVGAESGMSISPAQSSTASAPQPNAQSGNLGELLMGFAQIMNANAERNIAEKELAHKKDELDFEKKKHEDEEKDKGTWWILQDEWKRAELENQRKQQEIAEEALKQKSADDITKNTLQQYGYTLQEQKQISDAMQFDAEMKRKVAEMEMDIRKWGAEMNAEETHFAVNTIKDFIGDVLNFAGNFIGGKKTNNGKK